MADREPAPAWTLRALAAADLPAYKALRDQLLAAHPEAFTSDAASELAKPAASLAAQLGSTGVSATFTLGAWHERHAARRNLTRMRCAAQGLRFI